ncbi:MAG: precorrin-6A reductase [Tumebacillaceae bacterium]
MILHLAGTSDARELALQIQAAGHELLASVVTESAAKGLSDVGIPVRMGRLTAVEMSDLIRELGVTTVVDASHPFAEEASKNAIAATKACDIPYIRFERENVEFAETKGLYFVDDYQAAADLAAELKGTIMLTTGSKTLHIFTQRLLGVEGVTLVARMLPRLDNMEKCAELGVEQKHIIAMQGPFSKELNIALYRNYNTDVVITKESGKVGSVDEKVTSALELGLKVIVIGRPGVEYGVVYTEFAPVLQHLNQLRGEITHGI